MKKTSKKLFVIMICMSFWACSTTPHTPFYINQAMKAQNRNFQEKIPHLEPVWQNETDLIKFDKESSFIRVNTPMANKFYREVETNLIDIEQEKKGYLLTTPIISKQEGTCEDLFFGTMHREAYCLISILGLVTAPLCLLTFLPEKISYCKSFVELESRVLDNSGTLIKKYSSEIFIDANEVEAFSQKCEWGENCQQKIKWLSYEKALEDILNQIYEDRIFLKNKLEQQ